MPGGFQAQSNYKEEAAGKAFSFLDMISRARGLWNTVAWLLSFFSGDLSSEDSYSDPHPTQEGDRDAVSSEKVDSHIESRPGEGRNSMA